uniref:Putative secreted protein n=1 Tax=Ixodes ricinus TaxID=34613 RepID=A0A6B0V1S4_IXORI
MEGNSRGLGKRGSQRVTVVPVLLAAAASDAQARACAEMQLSKEQAIPQHKRPELVRAGHGNEEYVFHQTEVPRRTKRLLGSLPAPLQVRAPLPRARHGPYLRLLQVHFANGVVSRVCDVHKVRVPPYDPLRTVKAGVVEGAVSPSRLRRPDRVQHSAVVVRHQHPVMSRVGNDQPRLGGKHFGGKVEGSGRRCAARV